MTIKADVQGFSELYKKVCKLVEVPRSAYKNLHDGWWLLKDKYSCKVGIGL